MKLFTQLFDFESEETTGEVVFFKLFELFIAIATLHLAWMWAFYIPRISDVVLPLGAARFFDVSFMFSDTLPYLNAALISALVVLGCFRVWKLSYAVAFLLLHLQYAARFSLGEIPHSSNMTAMCLLGLALALAAFPDSIHRRRFTMGFTYFYIGLGYSLAGITKLVGTGLNWSDGRHLWMWVNEKGVDVLSKFGVLEPNVLQDLTLASLTFATLVLTIGWLTELGAFLIWFRRLRTPVILAVLGLHIGIDLIMSIFFYLSVILLVFVGFPWARWIDRALGSQAVATALEPATRLFRRFA